MPIWIRKFTFQKIKEYYEKQAEETEKQQAKANNIQSLAKPNIKPTYTAKASPK